MKVDSALDYLRGRVTKEEKKIQLGKKETNVFYFSLGLGSWKDR